jgi:hypothetical protein
MNEIVISGRLYDEAPIVPRNNAPPVRGTVDEILEQAEQALQRAEAALVEAARLDMAAHVEMLSSQNR